MGFSIDISKFSEGLTVEGVPLSEVAAADGEAGLSHPDLLSYFHLASSVYIEDAHRGFIQSFAGPTQALQSGNLKLPVPAIFLLSSYASDGSAESPENLDPFFSNFPNRRAPFNQHLSHAEYLLGHYNTPSLLKPWENKEVWELPPENTDRKRASSNPEAPAYQYDAQVLRYRQEISDRNGTGGVRIAYQLTDQDQYTKAEAMAYSVKDKKTQITYFFLFAVPDSLKTNYATDMPLHSEDQKKIEEFFTRRMALAQLYVQGISDSVLKARLQRMGIKEDSSIEHLTGTMHDAVGIGIKPNQGNCAFCHQAKGIPSGAFDFFSAGYSQYDPGGPNPGPDEQKFIYTTTPYLLAEVAWERGKWWLFRKD